MGQSLVKNYIHIIFSTKDYLPLIKPSFEKELYNYIGGICQLQECKPLIVGGHLDHVHVLCMLSKKTTLVKLVQEIKTNSSRWSKKLNKIPGENFSWQNGYGAFSVNPREVDVVINYIKRQHIHHAQKTFKQEYLTFLKQYKVDYNEEYLWS